jgi:hypothetical protein
LTASSSPTIHTPTVQPTGWGERASVLLVSVPHGAASILAASLRRLDGGRPFASPEDASDEGGCNAALLPLHDRFLAELGTSRNDPLPTGAERATPLKRIAFAAELRRLVNPILEHRRLLIEEPSVGLLLPVWMEALSSLRCRIACILVVRHPDEVAASLAAYDDLSLQEGLMLWLRYVLDAERETRGVARVVVMHHEVLQDSHAVLDRICDHLNLTGRPGVQASDAPSSTTKERTDRNSGALADLCRQAWAAVSTLATDSRNQAAQTTLDQVGRAYREAAALFGPALAAARAAAVEHGQRQRESTEVFKRRVRRYEEVAAERDGRIAALTTEATRWREQAAALATTCASAEQDLVGLRAEQAAAALEIEQLRTTLRVEADEALRQAAQQLRVMLAAERYSIEMEREQNRRSHQQLQGEQQSIAAELTTAQVALAQARELNEQMREDAAASLKTARGSLITTIAELRWQERLSKRRSDARVEELQQSVADLAVRLDHAHSETEQGRQEMAAMAEELAAKTAELRAIHASLTWRLSHPFKRRE